MSPISSLRNKEHAIRKNHASIVLLALVALVAIAVESQSKDAERSEDWVYIQNAELRVGLLRSHGGAIGYLSDRNSRFNALNHDDHGRLIQQSYYGDKDGSRWGDKPWRYNPVQGGDSKGKAAKLVNFKATGTTAYAKTVPRHWASGQLLEDCTMEQWVELDGPIVRVRFKFTYNGLKSHKPWYQEMPAVFVSPKLSTLVTYTGQKPWTGSALTRKKPGWPNEHVALSESWAAFVDEYGNGIGVYVPGTTEATAYRFKGGSGTDCSYIAPLRTFALTPELSFSYSAYFTLGNVDTIRDRFARLQAQTK